MAVSKDIGLNLREKLYIIGQRKWILIASVVVLFCLVAIGNFTATPIYKAITRLRIEPKMPEIGPFKELYSISGRQLDYYNTQYKILKSRALAKKVLESLPSQEASRLNPEQLLGMVTIKPIAQSQLVDIAVVAPDPEFASLIANSWGDQFIRLTIESKLEAIQTALSQMTKKLDEQNETVKTAQQELMAYKERERIVSQDDIQNELNHLSDAYSSKKREREEKELQLSHLKKYAAQGLSLETFPQIRYHSIIMQLKNRLVQLQASLSQNSQRYKAKHPKMMQIQAEIETVKTSLDTEIKKIIQGLQTEHEMARSNEDKLLKQLEKQKTVALNMEKKVMEIEDLKTRVTIKREGQQALLSRVNETSMTKGIEITNIMVIDYAKVPTAPFKPRIIYNLFLSLIIGTAGGIGIIFLLENLDNTIKTANEAQKILKIPFLGAIPSYPQANIKPGQSLLKTIQNPIGLISEAFRTIRTGIYFPSDGISPQLLLITSSLPQEGKTDISSMLSVILSQGDENVLLIDGDMRKPRIGKIFGADKTTPGLSELLSGRCEIPDVIQKTEFPRLNIITSGKIPPNPAELINSGQFKVVLSDLRKSWDRIILDSPPLLSVTDPTILGRMVDGVILVIKAGNTGGKMAAFCQDKLKNVNAHFIGMILNGIDIHRGINYYYYYSRYYSPEPPI